MADNEKVEKNEDEMKKDVSKKADDVPDAQSPITQVNTRDNDAPFIPVSFLFLFSLFSFLFSFLFFLLLWIEDKI